ncbi:MAG: LPS export ABC transporter periplasmic protein LptC [Gammaproteobacteria bacterium RIFCSPHIGHO2_12_FULL_45_9]|nr:MAG: LPS export ABC transporter periplasmic protein LptC [Gammaproteobacteria bacterium RIFCSPHIGHO2_12_FULL_45_9]
MSGSRKVTYLYIFSFVLICVTSALILHHNNQQKSQNTQNNIIDGFASHATLTEYDEQGNIKTVLTAESATHLEPGGTTHFKKPFIITYTKDRTPWHIHADQGISDRDGHHIIFQHHILIHALPTTRHPETRITTDELTILPKESRAFTDKPVILSRPGMVIHGVGLTANFKTGEYQLRSQSEAVYQPSGKRN